MKLQFLMILFILVLSNPLLGMREQREVYELKNGATVPQELVVNVMKNLNELFNVNKEVFHDLVAKCHDKKHTYHGSHGKIIKLFNLLPDSPGISDIILSAVEGSGINLKLTSPIKAQ